MKNKLNLINKYAVKKLSEDDVFVFTLVLCDNEIDRENERFSIKTLFDLKELFLGKTGIFDHNHSSKNQVARIFSTMVAKDENRKTKAREVYHSLKAEAYMVRSKENHLLIKEIESGIKKEVSVGCSVDRILCSKCGQDQKQKSCGHFFSENKEVHKILEGAKDAYEWSFVAVPAQLEAGVVKKSYQEIKKSGSFLTSISHGDFKRLKNEAEDGKRYKESIKSSILKDNFLQGEDLCSSTVKGILDRLTVDELLEYQKAFIKPVPDFQIKAKEEEEKSGGNGEYKIRSV